MQAFFSILQRTPLFTSIDQAELGALLTCLGATETDIPKDGFALRTGDTPDHIGVVLEGQLEVAREDSSGSRALLAVLSPGDFYGEALVFAGVAESPVSVSAAVPSKVLKLGFGKLLTTCQSACAHHAALVRNMVGIIAQKNMQLQSRMEILDKKTIRERLLTYLNQQKKQLGNPFTITLNRNELADYLSVDRSALSRELSHLAQEGILAYHKNRFELL